MREKKAGPDFSPGHGRVSCSKTVADVDVDDVARSLGRGEEHPGVIPGAGHEIKATGAMFWVSSSGRIHTTWVTTLACPNRGAAHTTLVVVGGVGGDPSVAGGVVQQDTAWPGGRVLPWQVPWEGPQGEV